MPQRLFSWVILFLLVISSLYLFSCTSKNNATSYTIPLQQPEQTAPLTNNVPEEVKLAAGDVLMIEVWGQDGLTKEVTLDAAGNIYYPFIGKTRASGKTVEELQVEIQTKLSRYYTSPEVTVTPKDLVGQKYYVLGEVNVPGNFAIKAQTTVFEAIATAGGPTTDAGAVVILLRKQKQQLLIAGIPVQFVNVTENNISSVTNLVQSGDVLYLPPSKIADVERFMTRLNNIINPLLALERGLIFWPQLIDVLQGTSDTKDIIVPLQ